MTKIIPISIKVSDEVQEGFLKVFDELLRPYSCDTYHDKYCTDPKSVHDELIKILADKQVDPVEASNLYDTLLPLAGKDRVLTVDEISDKRALIKAIDDVQQGMISSLFKDKFNGLPPVSDEVILTTGFKRTFSDMRPMMVSTSVLSVLSWKKSLNEMEDDLEMYVSMANDLRIILQEEEESFLSYIRPSNLFRQPCIDRDRCYIRKTSRHAQETGRMVCKIEQGG